ncbi:MAG TPA: T9SS type A sorting domain-containing protein [Caldithrix sp.]|nr:T9SS type A sorting domain-containing protein [Caldithrix sp.]
MKRFMLMVLVVLFSVQFSFAELKPGTDYSDHSFWIVFQPSIENITIEHLAGRVRCGIRSVDALFNRFQPKQVVQEVPFAQPQDRDGDIVMSNVYRVEVETNKNILATIREFSRDPNIVLAEPIPIYRVFDITPFIPNDSYYSSQWHLPKIQAPYAWGMWNGATPGSDTVVVAILDTGVDWDHPDLINNIWQNLGEDADGDGHTLEFIGGHWVFDPGDLNGVDDDDWDNSPSTYIDDLIGWDFVGATVGSPNPDNDPHSSPNQGYFGELMHGTHVAGTASPTTNNGIGVAGPGFQARIMAIKLAYDNDVSGPPGVYSSPSSYIYPARAGAHVLNCSFGGPGYSGIIQSAINLAHNVYGAAIVAAAGNDNANLQQFHQYPSDYQNVISVAALTSADTKASFSNYGPTVDISAPGVNIWSTVYKNVSGGYQGSQWSGTSMASPIVAGSYALLKAFFPTRSTTWLEQRLIASADNIDALNPNYAGLLGSGRVNIYSAIAQGILPNLSYQAYTLQIPGDVDGQLNPGETALMRVTIKNAAGWHVAAGVTAVLRSPTGELHISDSTATYPDISPGSIGINLIDRFKFTVDSNASLGNIPVEMLVKANQDSAVKYDVTLHFDITVSINQVGWPQAIGGKVETNPVVIDLDNNGSKEVLATAADNKLYAWEKDGTVVTGFPYTVSGVLASPAVGDVDGNGDMEIALTSKNNHFYLLNHDGSVMLDYNAGTQIWGTPTLVDLNGNGDLEAIFGDFLGKLHVLNHDGTTYGNFPVDLGTSHRILSGVAVEDLNNDGVKDIAFDTFNGDVYAISSGDAGTLTGFPVNVGGRSEAAPVIADLDGTSNRPVEMVVVSINKKLSIIDGQGNLTAQYSFSGTAKNTPALADLNNDGLVDILFGTDANRFQVIDFNGNSLPGFPISTGGDVVSAPAIADLNDDGFLEIGFTSNNGMLYLVDHQGNTLAGFPTDIGSLQKSAPTLDNVDSDNDLELLVGTSTSLTIFDLPKVGSNSHSWFTLQGNYQRTGSLSDLLTGTRRLGNTPVAEKFELSQNYPNPFNPVTEIRFTLPARREVELIVFNTLGQKVKTLATGVWDAGTHRLQWAGKNDRGQAVSSGIYFYTIKTGNLVQTRKMILMR